MLGVGVCTLQQLVPCPSPATEGRSPCFPPPAYGGRESLERVSGSWLAWGFLLGFLARAHGALDSEPEPGAGRRAICAVSESARRLPCDHMTHLCPNCPANHFLPEWGLLEREEPWSTAQGLPGSTQSPGVEVLVGYGTLSRSFFFFAPPSCL
jgi:hypothetical protein